VATDSTERIRREFGGDAPQGWRQFVTAEAPERRDVEARRPFPARVGLMGALLYKMVVTTDHKVIGIIYCSACFVFSSAA